MNKLNAVKTVLQYTAAFGAGGVVSNVCLTYTPPETNGLKRIAATGGRWALMGLASKAVFDYVGQEFDDVVELFRDADAKIKEKK